MKGTDDASGSVSRKKYSHILQRMTAVHVWCQRRGEQAQLHRMAAHHEKPIAYEKSPAHSENAPYPALASYKRATAGVTIGLAGAHTRAGARTCNARATVVSEAGATSIERSA